MRGPRYPHRPDGAEVAGPPPKVGKSCEAGGRVETLPAAPALLDQEARDLPPLAEREVEFEELEEELELVEGASEDESMALLW